METEHAASLARAYDIYKDIFCRVVASGENTQANHQRLDQVARSVPVAAPHSPAPPPARPVAAAANLHADSSEQESKKRSRESTEREWNADERSRRSEQLGEVPESKNLDGNQEQSVARKVLRVSLSVSLDELFTGCTKKVRLVAPGSGPGEGERNSNNSTTYPGAGIETCDARAEEQGVDQCAKNDDHPAGDRTITVKIGKGWRHGTTIVFQGKSRDLALTIVEKKHPTFTRVKDDLHCTASGSNGSYTVTHIDGRVQQVAFYAGSNTITIHGAGMPRSNSKGRGNLIVSLPGSKGIAPITESQAALFTSCRTGSSACDAMVPAMSAM